MVLASLEGTGATKSAPSTLQTSLMRKRCNEVGPEKVKEVNGVKEVEDLMVSIAF